MASNSPPLAASQVLWLLAAALAGLLPLAPHVPPWLAALALLLLAARALLLWRGRALPPRGLVILLALAGCAGVLAQYRTLFGQNPGVALLVLFLALKPLESRARRDGYTIVFLLFFLALAQFFFAQSIASAAATLATALAAAAALGSLADAEAPPAALLRRTAVMLAQAMPLMLILFLLFPRVQGPLWGLPRDAFSALTGLADSMSPGSISNLSMSDAIAFRARFEGELPPRDRLYWRGPVLADFDGLTWRPERRLPLPRLAFEPAGPAIEYEVTLEAHAKPWLFALELPGLLPEGAAMTGDYQLLARVPVTARQRYAMRSHVDMQAGRDEAAGVLKRALALPDGYNPKTRELAAGWRAKNPDARAILAAAEDFFLRQGLRYTLTPPLLGRDGIDEFLYDTRQGFCEHFAGAFVFALRAAGVPARVVTGYQGGEINPFDGYFTVRQYDAHAWAEVWLDGEGWRRVDPTSISIPLRIDRNLAAAVPAGDPVPLFARTDLAWLRELRLRLDAVTNSWNQWVIGYNPQRQHEFLRRMGMSSPDWRQMTAVLAVLCGVVLLGLTGWTLRQRRRLDPAQRVWLRLGRRLARHGLPRHDWEGPRAYCERVAARFPRSEAEIRAISALYGRLRYGSFERMLFDEFRRRVARFHP